MNEHNTSVKSLKQESSTLGRIINNIIVCSECSIEGFALRGISMRFIEWNYFQSYFLTMLDFNE